MSALISSQPGSARQKMAARAGSDHSEGAAADPSNARSALGGRAGADAIVVLIATIGNRPHQGDGRSGDIMRSWALAFLDALNQAQGGG